jgi:hypothetical protein
VHCRFAMLGAAGILVPDLFHSIGAGGPAAQIPWYDHAKFEYYAPIKALFGVQVGGGFRGALVQGPARGAGAGSCGGGGGGGAPAGRCGGRRPAV